MKGDYLLIECDKSSQNNCYFIIYYMYKSDSIVNDHICQHNEFPKQFKFVMNLISNLSIFNSTDYYHQNKVLIKPIHGISVDQQVNEIYFKYIHSVVYSVFLIILILLLLIWISTIIGCIISRKYFLFCL